MKYLSVCSGIEAASVAWRGLGWEPVAFSEIEKFPCAVLRKRFPRIPNLGDMTKIRIERDESDGITNLYGVSAGTSIRGNVDLLVGGTPCQDVSVAGKRAGLVDGERSSLAFEYARLAGEASVRWLVWENVPGVLSSHAGRDFAAFLSSLAKWDVPVPDGGWKNAGIVQNNRGGWGLAYRVLDAQYTRVPGFPRAIPQRRRRVFVVGYRSLPDGNPLDWQRAAAVLFDGEGVSGDPPPRGKERETPAGDTEGCTREADRVEWGRNWDETGVNPTISQCNEGSGGIAASNQDLFSQNMNGLVMKTYSAQSISEFRESDVGSVLKERDCKQSTTDLVMEG